MKKIVLIAITLASVVILSVSLLTYFYIDRTPTSSTVNYTYSIVNVYPHDTNAFTEGLVYSGGYLYESTGAYGSDSTLRRVDLTTGKVLQEYTLPSQYFGEGITIVNNTIIQLTWQNNIGFIYDKNTFTLLGNFSYSTEGWGLTFDGKNLIMSDGTNHLYFLSPTTHQQVGEVTVHDGNQTIDNINELEYINGAVYANIWLTTNIVIINPSTGQVTAWINLASLPGSTSTDPNFVLNGIAYDQQNNKLFVTGKDWPNLYQIKLVAQS